MDILIWNDLCGTDNKNVTIWENGDFNSCFEKLCFSALPHFILTLASSFHFSRHQHMRQRGLISRYLTLHFRLFICVCFLLSALFLFAIEYAYNRKFPSLVNVVWGLIHAICWLVHSGYIWRLHRLPHLQFRGHWSVLISYSFVILTYFVSLRTAVRKSVYSVATIDDFEEIYIYAIGLFHIFYSLTLLKNKKTDLVSGLQESSVPIEGSLNLRDGSNGSFAEECPEDNAWFISKLFFCWIQPLMKKGYKQEISTIEDIFDLPESLQTSNILHKFLSVKNNSTSPTKKNANFFDTSSINPQESLIRRSSLDQREEIDKKKSGQADGYKKQKNKKSLLSLLVSLYGCEYFSLGILKLLADACSFCSPILLNLLILFVSDEEGSNAEPIWHGYLCCFGLFCATFLGSLFSTHFDYLTSRISLKFRAVIVDSIYKKTLSTSQVHLRNSFNSGEIVNLMSTDADRVVGFCPSFHMFWSLPLQVGVVLYLLYIQVGIAFLAGVVFAILLIPVNRWIAIKIGELSQRMMSQKDARVKLINETLHGMRAVKFHAWEEMFSRKITMLRGFELSSLKKRKYLDALCVFFWATTPIVISILTFTTYVFTGHSLTAAKVFTSISLFAILITPLNAFPWVVNGLMEAWVSLKRIQRLLDLEDLNLHSFYDLHFNYIGFLPYMSEEPVLRMKDVSFSWNATETITNEDNSNSTVPNYRINDSGSYDDDDDLILRSDDNSDKICLKTLNLEIQEGMFVGVVGEVGSGKSSLLYAILGEMKRARCVGSEFVLEIPVDDGFGFFSQESWIQRGTLRNNILFGKSYDPIKYDRIIKACALDVDIDILPDGDLTEIGENGVTLSGGQKARVSLARTVYQEKNFYLLDDPYAAVDGHVALHIHSECTMGLLHNVTRILVTHHVRFLHDADLIVVMEKGKILKCGTPSRVNLESLHSKMDMMDEIESKSNIDSKECFDENAHSMVNCAANPTVVLEDGRGNKGYYEHDIKSMKTVVPQNERDDDDDDLIDVSAEINDTNDDNEIIIAIDDAGADVSEVKCSADDDDENKEIGVVKLKVYATYWKAVGNCLAISILLSLLFMQASRNICDWWLSYWVTHAVNQSNHSFNLVSTSEIYSLDLSNASPILPIKIETDNSDQSVVVFSSLMNEIYRTSLVLWNFKYSSEKHPTRSMNLMITKDMIYNVIPSGSTSYANITDDHEYNYSDFKNNSDIGFYMTIYGSLAAFNALATILRAVLFAYGGIEAARVMHSRLVDSVFKATINFFDTTPVGRLINRFSSDIFSIDDSLPFILNIFLAQSFGLLGSIVICCYGLPFSAILIIFLSTLYYFIQGYYRQTSRELKRITCITLSPIYAHFSETLNGLSVIRAHRHTSRFEHEAQKHLDLNQRAQFASRAISQWLSIRFQMIGVSLVTCVSIMAVLQKEFGTVNPGLIGLAISYVLSITNLLSGLIMSFTETEKLMIGVERVNEYINTIPHENIDNQLESIPPTWPFVGVVTFTDVTLRYRVNLPDALKGVTFETRPGERIGVVGRTGSGKSSLFLALLRMVNLRRGRIYIDGVDVHQLPLRKYRSKVSIIPQDPFLFSGTIRENIDPSGRHSDDEITSVLVRCNMLEVVEDAGGLGSEVEERGQTFSVGQRQLLCLARAMLSQAQVLCIDEATASVDIATDRMLQATISSQFKGKTVMTIAHRMETVLDCDRIIVMNGGKITEFEAPCSLLENPESLFSRLLEASKTRHNPHRLN